jgi:hypothetical protein
MLVADEGEDEFRGYAEHCRAMARSSLSATDRQHWQQLFDYWSRREAEKSSNDCGD